MKACALTLLATALVLAADQRQLALSLKAQTDFDRVAGMMRSSIPDTETCLQSQAAALAVSPPDERALLYYHKGYCAYTGGTATQDPHQFQAAVESFDKAVESWPERQRKVARNAPPTPVSGALRVFAAIARLQASNEPAVLSAARQELAAARQAPACNSDPIPASVCVATLADGAQWEGWLALRDNQLDDAARLFSPLPATGWYAWTQGRRSLAAGQFAAAVNQYTQAIDQWKRIWQGDGPTSSQALGPRPQLASALADLGGARLLSGDLPGAIATLDSSLQLDAASPHALFLRARAKELAGRSDAALADYNLASRSAFAAAVDLASGEAHLYRGILLFRRRDFARAEEEFASALNFEMTPALLPDARAWRHLAAVAGGSCGPARQFLNQALPAVSPFFPQAEARSLAAACAAPQTPQQMPQ